MECKCRGIQKRNKTLGGRAVPALLDKVNVEYYGTSTPLNQLATISD